MSIWRRLDTTSVDALANDWWNRLREAQFAHYLASNIYRLLHFALGILVITCSTLVLAWNFSGKTPSVVPWLAVAAAVSGSVQTFMQPSELSERHRAAGGRFSSLRREMEQFMAAWTEGRVSQPDDVLTSVRNSWQKLLLEVPILPRWIWMQGGRPEDLEPTDWRVSGREQ